MDRHGLTATALKGSRGTRPATITDLRNGENTETKHYEDIAAELGFRDALEMFRIGEADDDFRPFYRVWKALADEDLRKEWLAAGQEMIVQGRARSAREAGAPTRDSQSQKTGKTKP